MTGRGIVTSVKVVDKAANGSAYTLTFFSANPSGTTFTDNATLAIADSDMAKICSSVELLTTDAVQYSDNCISEKINLVCPVFVSVPYTGILYGVLIARGSPTYVAITDVSVTITTLCD